MWQREVAVLVEGGGCTNSLLTSLRYAEGSLSCATGSIGIRADGRMDLLTGRERSAWSYTIDLEGYLVLPGLINAHDHLQYALHPRLGNPPYSNYVEWGEDIHATMPEVIERYNAIDRTTRLWWGGIRNLLSGVTTVCHHDKPWPILQSTDFPIKVLARHGWAHSVALDTNLRIAHASTAKCAPFFIHAGEGTDTQSFAEFRALEDLGVLDDRTVLVHGLALDKETAQRLQERGVSLVLCPSSNQFLYERLPDMASVEHIHKLALGNDSPISARGDLLDEVRFASESLQLSCERLYNLVTIGAADVLRLHDGEGAIRHGAVADLFAVRDSGRAPAERLHDLCWQDVELVVVGGRIQLASEDIYSRLPEAVQDGFEPLEIDGVVRLLKAPVGDLWREAAAKLAPDVVRLGGRVATNPERVVPKNRVFEGRCA
jgi:cytosine/adenosine deaminase-related metal-dependent hydrolase